LHRLVYVVAVLGVVHYWWQIKSGRDAQPLPYAVLLAVLLGVRLHHWLVHSKPAVTPPNQRVQPPQAHEKASH
jgi:sulfoxide reductase heme-binding subunit YedZ